jgi:NADPH:quinone reductase-like Zn-dependent oxidoreductase
MRTLYLKDLTLFGCTFQDDSVSKNIVKYIEQGEIRSIVAYSYPLKDISGHKRISLIKNL